MRPFSTLPVFLATSLIGTTFAQSPISPDSFAKTKFDVVIVGGGTAGLVLANRLSQTLSVGLIDAGTYNASGDPIIDIPNSGGFFVNDPSASLLFNPKYDWMFQSVPQSASDDTVIAYNRGKVLGGSSAINDMVWTRGEKDEYDAWETLGNGNNWNFQSMLPYFERSESWTPPNSTLIPGTSPSISSLASVHGKSGPISARYNVYRTGLETPITEASVALGSPANPNPDAGNSTFLPVNGITNSVSPSTEKRSYAVEYYKAASSRKNLVVVLNSQVSRIIWDNSTIGSEAGAKATGVEYVSGNQKYVVSASQEVILSAGSLKTPQVLELSGVGNATLLKSLGIPVTLDFPQIGENLMDHPITFTDFVVKPGVQTFDQFGFNQSYLAQQKALYSSKAHSGAFSYAATVVGSFPLQSAVSPSVYQSMRSQLDSQLGSLNLTPLQKAQYDILKNLADAGEIGFIGAGLVARGGIAGPAAANTSYITLATYQLHEFSRGSVHINTTVPTAPPLIDPKFMSIQWDLDVQVHSGQLLRKLTETKPFSDFVASPNIPSASVQTDDQWADYVKKNLATISHPMGTTVMAPQNIGGVVDDRLRVYGLQNVRVVDAGVIPFTVGCPIQSTVYMLAEQAADFILQDLNSY